MPKHKKKGECKALPLYYFQDRLNEFAYSTFVKETATASA